MHYRLHEKLFGIICLDVKLHCETGAINEADWRFIEELPEMAEFFGFEARTGSYIKREFHAIIKAPPKKRKEEGIPYRYEPRVGPLFQEGYSIREIVELLGHTTKAHVERSLREYRAMPHQLFFEFYYGVQVAPAPVLDLEPEAILHVSVSLTLFPEWDAA